MDYIQFILYAVLAVLTYLLILAWQKDYSSMVEEAVHSNGIADLDSLAVELASAGLARTPQNIAGVEPSGPGTLNTSNLVRVRTDTLDLAIDLTGGDISYLALRQFPANIDTPEDPFVLLESSQRSEFVAQSGILNLDSNTARAHYQAESNEFELSDSQDQLQVDLLTTTAEGIEVTKRFVFERGSYLFSISFMINNQSNETWTGNPFSQIKRDSSDDPSKSSGFSNSFLGFVTTAEDDPYIKLDFDELDRSEYRSETNGGWMGFSQKYFLTALVPATDSRNIVFTRQNQLDQYYGGFTASSITIEPQATGNYTFSMYTGPKQQAILETVAPHLELTIDYGILNLVASPINWLLNKINLVIQNFGYSIIVLTLLMKAAFYRLSESQYKSSANMRRIAPKIQALRDRYGEDKLGFQKASMELYKKENVSLAGGCLPAIVQMPVFIALYWVLLESVELRHAPFALWITDLSVSDPYFVLPILMGLAMWIQFSLNPAPADPLQAKIIRLLPLVMTVLFLTFPAGLVLYTLTNSILSMGHQWMVTRRLQFQTV